MKLLAAIAVATLTTIGLIPPATAATAAGAGIEVNGRYIGGFTITRDAETREELVEQLSTRPITFERDFEIPVDAEDPKSATLNGKIRLLSKIRGDRQTMAETAVLQLVKREGKWYVQRKSLQRALRKAKEDAAKVDGLVTPKGDLVFVEAFVGGIQRIVLAHKAYSADKKLFAGYYRDGFDEVISIHDAKSGKQIRRILGHGDDVRELKFTPDGKLLASRCENPGRQGWALWNVESGELVLRLPVPPSDD